MTVGDLVTLSKGVGFFKEKGRNFWEKILQALDMKFSLTVEEVVVDGSEGPTVERISTIPKKTDITGSFVCRILRADQIRIFAMSKSVVEATQSSGSWVNQAFTVYKNGWIDLGKIGLSAFVVRKSSGTTFTADDSTDVITANAHGLVNGDAVQVSNSGGGLPGGLSAATTYYVISSTTNTFQLSATLGGAAINLSSAGTGTNSFFLVYKEGVDYEVMLDSGMFGLTPTSPIADGATIHISASYAERKTQSVDIGNKPELEGHFRFEGQPVKGVASKFEAYVKLMPEGDFTLVGEDIVQFTVKFSCLKEDSVKPLAKWTDRSGKSFAVAAVA